MENADKTTHPSSPPSPRDAAPAPVPKSPKAEIPRELKEICERYGEDVIGLTLASGHTPRAKELQTIYATDASVEHARTWLTERGRSRRWREGITFATEIAVALLILGEILLVLWQGHLQSLNFNEQQQVLRNLQSSSAETANTLAALQRTAELTNTTLQKQLDALKKSEAQAERSAKAGEASAATASQALHVSERAYVEITPSLAKPPAAGEKLQFFVALNNSGRTPALEMRSHINGMVRPSSASANEVYAEVIKFRSSKPSQSGSVGTLPPGPAATNTLELPTPLTQPALDQIIEGKELIYIFATASYKDIFGQPHHTEICSFYRPKNNSFSPCHEFNKSD